eukprot:CAMPEP_0174710324 /NCGR_PEP_ID=MMETSP1094-20130205/11988_1 /TAXON_ID=156173 /ORGANISM="Chrysochromulina brevifilum, Strain UTEX LB 985" /LENGTH=122 /DNA_ID=CAMNT_0015909109 /DNA_START=432 /DNA_END=800 /DNA_ORIENTATION=-
MRVHSLAPRALCEHLVAGKHDAERVGVKASPRQLAKRATVATSQGGRRKRRPGQEHGRARLERPVRTAARTDAGRRARRGTRREPGGADRRDKFKVDSVPLCVSSNAFKPANSPKRSSANAQ